MAEDYKKKVKDQESINSGLYTRMREDEDLLYLFEYVMRDADKRRVPGIINVTLNRPAVFAANIIAALGTTSEQRTVETEDKNIDTAYIEDFQKAAFASANDRLRKQGRPQLNPFFDTQLCIRGRGAARCVFQIVDGVLVTDIVQWDARYVTYEMGTEGLEWAAYKTRRPKDEIQAFYGEELNHFGMSISAKEAEILDVWHKEGNEVSVAGKKILEQEHSFGFTPVAIQVVSLGYGAILLDVDSDKKEGESIFFLIRGVIPEFNRLASIVQTLTLKSVKPPMQERVKAGRGTKPRKYEDVAGIGASNVVDAEGGISPIDFGDVKRAASVALGMFDEAIAEGSLSSADLGRIGSPPASGIRAIIAGENRDQVVHPRLEAKALLNESLAEMFTRQVIQTGASSVELGVPGHKRTFQVSKLDGEYTTTYKFTAKSPVTDAGLYSLAAAAGNLVSDKYKATHILKLEDPDGDERQKSYEKAGRLNPRVEQYRIIRDLILMGEDEDAKLMLDDLGVSLEQLLAGETAMPKPEKEDEPTQVLSLFGGQGGGGQRQPIVPEEEE